jgi:NADH:ubiquinone oxidoreductase subunit 6 (subunit J)
MDFDWTRVLYAGALIMMIVVIYPAFKWWTKHGPKAEKGDWNAALLPLVGVVLFILLLISLVR